MSITYADRIPNNVDLASDKVLQRALEHWQPEFLKWWADMGPGGLATVRRLPAHRGERAIQAAGRISTTSRCPSIAGVSS